MRLISPEEFKKKRKSGNGSTLTSPGTTKKSSLVSPEEFKARKMTTPEEVEPKPSWGYSSVERPTQRPPVVEPVVKKESSVSRIISKSLEAITAKRDSIRNREKSPKQLQTEQEREKASEFFDANPATRTVGKGLDSFARVLDFLKFGNQAGRFIDRSSQTGAEMMGSPVLSEKEDAGKVGNFVADYVAGPAMGFAVNPATGGGGVQNVYTNPATQRIAGAISERIASKLPNAGLTLNKAGTEIVDSTASKAVRTGTQAAIAEGTFGIIPALQADTNAGVVENVAANAALGGVIGGAAPVASAVGKRIMSAIQAKKGIAPEPSLPNDRIEEKILLEDPNVSDALDSFKRGEGYEQEYQQAIKDQLEYLKSSMKNREGVTQGQIVRDQTGDVVDRIGRISNNPVWYQEFNKANGRNPTQKDLRDLAKIQVDKGYQDEGTFIPPWRPKDIVDIDDELKGIQETSASNPEAGAALEGVSGTLKKERERLKRVMPESISAMAEKTADGRPLLERGSGGVGESVSGKPVKRADIIADLATDLDIPIRTGRFRQKAHGIHKTKSGVVRSKLTNDLPVIAHEVGHNLDKRYKLSSAQYDNELLVLGGNTSASGYSQEQVRREGVAEFFRLMLTDPASAQAGAPGFYSKFTQTVSKADMKSLMKAQERISRYIDQDLVTKSYSEMSVGQTEKTKLPKLTDLYTKFVDDLNPIKQMLKPLGNRGKRVFEDFWLLRGSSGRAQAFLKQGIVGMDYNKKGTPHSIDHDKFGKSFDEIITPIKQNLDEFRTYIKDKRAIELDKRGIMTGSDLTIAERKQALRSLESQYPHFKQSHSDLKEYQDALLNELIDAGMLTADDVATFKEGNQEYVPFFRVFESEAGAGPANGGRTNTGSGAANQSSPIKRIKGSDREIVDPLESIIKNTYQYIAIAERNKAMRNLIDAVVDSEDLGNLVEKIPTPMQSTSFSLEDLRLTLERAGAEKGSIDMDTMVTLFKPTNVIPGKENIITVFREGKREFYQLDPDLYRAVTAADKEQMNFLVRAANMPVRLLRSGIVNTLEFWLKNMFRDQFSAMVNSKNGYIPYIDMIKGMYHVLGKTDTFTKFMAAGGAQSMRQSLDRKYLQNDLRTILATSMKDKAMNIVSNPLEAMRALSELSEMGTRMGEFSKGVSKYSSPDQVQQSAVAARDLIDFSRAGTWGREINKLSAFWNAQVQGLDKTIRVFSNKKTAGKAFAKSVLAITAPTAALYAANKDDPRYQELPQWDKDLFWHFWVGDKHFRLPIPFELGVVFKVVPERLLGYATGEDDSFREFGKLAKDTFVPAPTNIIQTVGFLSALSPISEVMANKNFAGAPIVPRREQDDLPEDQAGPYTSGTAKLIAKVAGKVGMEDSAAGSPRNVDHIIRGYTGSIGQYITQGIDKATDVAGLTSRAPRPETGLEDKPLFKAIMGKPFGGGTDSTDKFYELLDKLTVESKKAEKREESFEEAGELKYLQSVQKMISDVSKDIRAVQDDPDMDSKEKAEEIRQLNLESNNFARMVLGLDPLEYEDVFK